MYQSRKKWKLSVHRERNFMGVHKPRLMDVSEGKSGWKGCVFEGY